MPAAQTMAAAVRAVTYLLGILTSKVVHIARAAIGMIAAERYAMDESIKKVGWATNDVFANCYQKRKPVDFLVASSGRVPSFTHHLGIIPYPLSFLGTICRMY